jgi:hypothetical protein
VGKKLGHRLYKPRRRRCAATNHRERTMATAPNQARGLDYVVDQLADRRGFRVLTWSALL